MELKDFISVTINQIFEGIIESQTYIKSNGYDGEVNVPNDYSSRVEKLSFDIAVLSTESNTKEIKGGITVAGLLKGGGSQENSDIEKNISRIKFSVNLHLPKSE